MTADPGSENQKPFWPWDILEDYTPHIRASGLQLARVCPGSMFLAQRERLLDREHSSAPAAIGTIGHKWLEIRSQIGPQAAHEYIRSQSVPDDFELDLLQLWEWTQQTGLWMRGADVLTEEEIRFRAGPVRIEGHADVIQILHSLAVVIDWKFYRDPSSLPSISDDLQMYAYAVGAADLDPEIGNVQVHRVLCYHQRSDTLELDGDGIMLARRALEEIAQKIWDDRRVFSPGAQCPGCFQRRVCPAYRSYEGAISAEELVPYREGTTLCRADDVIAVLLAAQQVEERILQAREAARKWVEENGPLVDKVSGKHWQGWSSARDTIMDPVAAVGRLGKELGSMDDALKACSTTKTALDRALKAADRSAKERREFIDSLRESGIIERRESSARWEWRAPKKETSA